VVNYVRGSRGASVALSRITRVRELVSRLFLLIAPLSTIKHRVTAISRWTMHATSRGARRCLVSAEKQVRLPARSAADTLTHGERSPTRKTDTFNYKREIHCPEGPSERNPAVRSTLALERPPTGGDTFRQKAEGSTGEPLRERRQSRSRGAPTRNLLG